MFDGPHTRADECTGEPWGARLWLSLAAAVIVATTLQSYGISTWPMADDEVLSLVQLRLFHVDASAFSFPADHLEKLPKAVPVWTAIQRRALAFVPRTEAGFRIPSVVCGVLLAAAAFVLAARWRGLWFAAALAIVLNGSQLFIHIAQIDRFYSLPLLLEALAFAAIWAPYGGAGMIPLVALLALLAMLSHNVTVAVFALAFVASCATYLLGRTPRRVVVRSGAAFLVTGTVYVAYLRPLITGWHTTGNPTQVLVSFTAHAGVPAIALGLLGGWLALVQRHRPEPAVWWALVFAGTVCLFQLSTFSWNPRYFVFFLPALWMLAADAMHHVAHRLGYGSPGAVWYASVVLLFLPGLLSHYQDGSRHDYRQAAQVLLDHYRGDAPILSDDAETISYYLPGRLRQHLLVRTKVRTPPRSEYFLVQRSNAWAPAPRIPDRRVDLLAEISRRRYDEFSHVVRVFRVAPLANQEPLARRAREVSSVVSPPPRELSNIEHGVYTHERRAVAAIGGRTGVNDNARSAAATFWAFTLRSATPIIAT